MEQTPNEGTVAELLAAVRGLLDDERARGQALDAKSSTLAGSLDYRRTAGRTVVFEERGACTNGVVHVSPRRGDRLRVAIPPDLRAVLTRVG